MSGLLNQLVDTNMNIHHIDNEFIFNNDSTFTPTPTPSQPRMMSNKIKTSFVPV